MNSNEGLARRARDRCRVRGRFHRRKDVHDARSGEIRDQRSPDWWVFEFRSFNPPLAHRQDPDLRELPEIPERVVDSSIQYGDIAAAELPASGPTSSPAPKPPGPDISKYPGVHPTAATTTTSGTTTTGGTGDELGTTTLEVGVDLDSARSPNIPPQAPPAAPQPPLSKAVRTSPKRNAPSEDRDPLSRYGYDQSSPSSTKEKDDLFEGDLISRYGYHEEPPSSEEDRPLLKRYGYYAYSDSLPPPEEEEDEQVSIDRSAFWWFSMGGIVAGIVAFAAAFVGSFFGNSLRRHRG